MFCLFYFVFYTYFGVYFQLIVIIIIIKMLDIRTFYILNLHKTTVKHDLNV